MRERRGDSAGERMADQMRGDDPLVRERGARRFDQSLEARVVAQRREAMAGQVDRQRWPRLGQQAMNGAPAIEIGAEAVQEHDRRALPSRQPQAVHVRLWKRASGARFDVARLHTPARAGAVHALEPQSALPRDAPRRGRRARALALVGRHRASDRTPVSRRAIAPPSPRRRRGRQRRGGAPSRQRTPVSRRAMGRGRRRARSRGRRNERLALGDDPADAGADGQHVASEAATNLSTPEAGASTSIAALSVSISNSVCPLATCAPSGACQRPIRPLAMSMSTRGMTISTATFQTS
jgi:hypothetical protein